MEETKKAVELTKPAEPVLEKIDEIDRMALELAKSRRETALAEAKTALAQNEKAELHYKNVVLQLYLKYKMDVSDALREDGTVLRGGNVEAK